jgi:hypothetical protein
MGLLKGLWDSLFLSVTPFCLSTGQLIVVGTTNAVSQNKISVFMFIIASVCYSNGKLAQ